MIDICIFRSYTWLACRAGLFIFLLCNSTSALDNTLTGVISDILYNPPATIERNTYHSQIHIHDQFSPILYNKSTSQKYTALTQIINNIGDLEYFFSMGKIDALISLSHYYFNANYRSSPYLIKNIQDFRNFTIGATGRFNSFSLGLHIGNHAPQTALLKQYSVRIQSDHQWQFSCNANVQFPAFNCGISLFNGPVYSSITSISNIDQTGFRTFPLCINQRTLSGKIQLTLNRFKPSISASLSSFSTTQIFITDNQMPSEISFNTYKISIDGFGSPFFTDSLFWSLQLNNIGGWYAIYNFIKDRFTFFKADSFVSALVKFSGGLKLPFHMIINSDISFYDLNGPSGFLKLSTFSNWSIFQPVDYKYHNLSIKYFQSGFETARLFSHRKLFFLPSFYSSYFNTKMFWEYSQKKVVVLFPVYSEFKEYTAWNLNGLLFRPSFTWIFRTGPISLSCEASQFIPILFRKRSLNKKQAIDSILIKQPTPHNNSHAITWGGTRAAIDFKWQIPAIR